MTSTSRRSARAAPRRCRRLADRDVIPERRTRANDVGAYGVCCGAWHSPIHKGENLHGSRQAVARFPTFTGELGAADSVGQHHASDLRGVAEHPPRQVGNCAKAGSTYGADITATWVRLAVSSKQAGRYGDTASLHHQRKGSRVWGARFVALPDFRPIRVFRWRPHLTTYPTAPVSMCARHCSTMPARGEAEWPTRSRTGCS